MDTSEHVKMCAKAVEIQELVPFRSRLGEILLDPTFKADYDRWEGSWFSFLDQPTYFALFHRDADEDRWLIGDYYTHEHAQNAIWIPQQKQLQEIMEDYLGCTHTPYFWLTELREWFLDPYGFGSWPFPKQAKKLEEWEKYVSKFTSMEQIWLAFVMKEIYNMQWDSEKEDWIKENNG